MPECIACGLTPEELELSLEDFIETEDGFVCPGCAGDIEENDIESEPINYFNDY